MKEQDNINENIADEVLVEATSKHCLNCGKDYEGNFCPECGQKADTKRLRLKNIFSAIVVVFTKKDNKTFRTCRELITQPGIVARDFILGRRGRYNAPLPLLIALVALFSIAVHYMPDAASPVNAIKIEVSSTITTSTDDTPEQVTKIISLWDSNIFNYISVDVFALLAFQEIFGNIVYRTIFCSLFCALPFWLVFRRRKLKRQDGQLLSLNIAEHFFALFYLSCISMMLAFVSLPLNFIPGVTHILNVILAILPTLIGVYMYRQMLGISWKRSIWLNLIGTLLTIVFIVLLVLILIQISHLEDFIKGTTVKESIDFNFSWDSIKQLLPF